MKNLLSNEKSPYLLQHKDNPVWWQPWSPDAFTLAKNQNKPIFLSVGYSTCHWCHVMEKDSFEKVDVAQLINQYFIPVKVDREERPDVDSVYMNAVQAMTGHGGWPMTVLLTPDGKPFWGGTFIPEGQLKELVTKAGLMWQTNTKDLIEGGERLTEFLRDRSQLTPGNFKAHAAFEANGPMKLFFESYSEKFDTIHGGNYGSPKFPPALSLAMLLRIYRRTGDGAALHMVTHTLDQMRRGGIYDQIGGGFHRYSVDDHWLVPHFEKMLYDNALMTTAYLEAFQVTQKNEYAQTARETLDYVLRDMRSKQGAYFSAEDADSENIEGKFYVWSEGELKQILGDYEFEKVRNVFNVTPEGNFHAHKTGDEVTEKRHGPPALRGNIFYLKPDFTLKDLKVVEPAITKLLAAREKRVRPHLDDKILTSWNGLMISAMALGSRVLGIKKYAASAAEACEFIWTHMRDKEGHLMRTWRDGESRHRAMSDDYAFFVAGLLDLYAADFNLKWIERAQILHRLQTELFWDSKDGSFFDSDGRDQHLITRAKNFEDNVVPAANSVSALNALRLYGFTGETAYQEQAEKILGGAHVFIEKYPGAVPKLLQSVDRLTDVDFQVVAVGALPYSFFQNVNQQFLPNLTLAWSEKNFQGDLGLLKDRPLQKNEPTFYVCEHPTCALPTHNAENVLEQIKVTKSFKFT